MTDSKRKKAGARRWNFHVCKPWGECTTFRLNIRTPWRFIIIALTPDSRVVERWHEPARWITVTKPE